MRRQVLVCQPIRSRFGPGQVHRSVPKANSGRGLSCFPWLFRSGYKSPRWTELQLEYWQTTNSSGPSQKALYCIRRNCWRLPVCHPPSIESGMAATLSSNATPFQEQIWMPSCPLGHFPTPIEPPEQAFPVPYGTASQNSTEPLPVSRSAAALWAPCSVASGMSPAAHHSDL